MRPAHHTTNGFVNPYETSPHGLSGVFKWKLGLGPDETPAIPRDSVPDDDPAIMTPNLPGLPQPDPTIIQLTWIGHSTFLIQVNGLNILTDPMFSSRCSPISFLGPKRKAPPGVPFDSLPPIDVVLISHNHYDHLDLDTIRRLGNKPLYLLPLGLSEWFAENSIHNVVEKDWWDMATFANVRFHCVPAQHFSARTATDRNATLWCGWVLESQAGRIYFAGDTGYCPYFKEIGARLGPMRLSLIPIGAYEPRWFMRNVHTNPSEAVQIHLDVQSRQSIAMHWGTFKLTDEPMAEPPLFLHRAKAAANVAPSDFVAMAIGQTMTFAP